MSKRSDTLKYATTVALNYAHYYMAFESLPVDHGSIDDDKFFKQRYEISEQIEGQDSVILLHLKNVNITAPINLKNNIDFGLNITYVLSDSTVTEVNVEILDIDFLEGEDIDVFVKDFINNYLKFLFSGIVKLFLEYDVLGVDNSDENVIFSKEVQLNFILDKKNNIQPSIKVLFLNNMDVIYDIEFKPELVDELKSYSSELEAPVKQLIDNNGSMVTELYEFDDGVVQVNTDLLEKNYTKLLEQNPETVGEVMRHLILNAIIRSGQATLGNMLALYDSTNFLSVNNITFSVLLTKDT